MLWYGFLTMPSADFNNLQKPFLAPSGILFPIVWTILYTLMGVSYGILKSKNLADDKINSIYYTQLFVNLLWPFFFFTFEWRLFSFFWIVLLDVLVIVMIKRFYNKDRASGLLQIPYLIWVLFATYLNFSFYILNR